DVGCVAKSAPSLWLVDPVSAIVRLGQRVGKADPLRTEGVSGRCVHQTAEDRCVYAFGMDATDLKILAQLRANARASFREIGESVGLSAPAVKRRVDRLEDAGAVRGYTTVVDPGSLGWPTVAVVELYCDGRMSGPEIKAAVAGVPEVAAAFTVAGAASAI